MLLLLFVLLLGYVSVAFNFNCPLVVLLHTSIIHILAYILFDSEVNVGLFVFVYANKWKKILLFYPTRLIPVRSSN